MNIILFGFKGVGKTHLGTKLAEKLNMPFIDIDQLALQMYELDTGKRHSTPKSAVQEVGIDRFRALEKEAVQSLQNVRGSVISLGGGTILDPTNETFLRPLGMLVYLFGSEELLRSRIPAGETANYLPEGSFDHIYEFRGPLYDLIESEQVVVDEKTDKIIVQELCELYKEKSKDWDAE